MLDALRKFQTALSKALDTFFHLPTLMVIALITLMALWQIYDIGLNLGDGFVRVNSNQGNLTLSWREGCCELDW
jgi:hypothetical protein